MENLLIKTRAPSIHLLFKMIFIELKRAPRYLEIVEQRHHKLDDASRVFALQLRLSTPNIKLEPCLNK